MSTDQKTSGTSLPQESAQLDSGRVFQYLLVCSPTELYGFSAVIQSRLSQGQGTGPSSGQPKRGGGGAQRGRGNNRGRGKRRGSRSKDRQVNHPEKGGTLTQPKEVKLALEAYLAARERATAQLSVDEKKAFKPKLNPELSALYQEYETRRAAWLSKIGDKSPSQPSSSDSKGSPKGGPFAAESPLGWTGNPLHSDQPSPNQEKKAGLVGSYQQVLTESIQTQPSSSSPKKEAEAKTSETIIKSVPSSSKGGTNPTGPPQPKKVEVTQKNSPGSHSPGSGPPKGKPGQAS
jgi:hypothetical protein